MLLFEPSPGGARWSLGHRRMPTAVGTLEIDSPSMDDLDEILDLAGEDVIAYVLPQGGEVFRQPVSRLRPKDLERLEACVPFFPGRNRTTFAVARAAMERRPHNRHYLLCETAFFAELPLPERAYGLPYELYEKGIRRYGGDGLCHQWVWEQVRARFDASRLLSVHLGDAPSLAAILDGRPVGTSMGFTPVEGIPSANGVGDLDPAIVLLLREKGMSVAELEHLFMNGSGWSAMVGRPVGFESLLRGQTPPLQAAREHLRAALLRAIGAGVAALGSVDTLAFASRDVSSALTLITELGHGMDIAGGSLLAVPVQAGDFWELSPKGSELRIVALEYERHAALAGWVEKGKENSKTEDRRG
jgi:acetate kinase